MTDDNALREAITDAHKWIRSPMGNTSDRLSEILITLIEAVDRREAAED